VTNIFFNPKKRSAFVVALWALFLLGCADKQQGSSILPAEAAGKLVLVNYWAEWCTPCRKEIPELNELARKNPDEVLVYGVNYDGLTGDELAAVEGRMGVEFLTLSKDPGPALGLGPPAVLPVTLIIGRNGELLDQLEGEQTLESLEARIKQVESR